MIVRKQFLLVATLVTAMLVVATACSPADMKALEGVVQKVDSVSGNVTVKLKDGSTATFNFTDVKADTIRQAIGSLSLETGDNVTIKEDKNGKVKELKVQNAEVEGVIKSLGTDNVTITTKKKGDITLKVTSDTMIKIEDRGKVALSDLKAGQKVEAKYDVIGMKALKLNVDIDVNEKGGDVQGTIKAISTDNKTITVTTKKKGDITLQITSETVIRVEDKGKAVFSDLKAGQKIEARYDISSMKALKLAIDTDEEDHEDKD